MAGPPQLPPPALPVIQQPTANQGYINEVMRMFSDEKFMKAPETQKKHMVGSYIFPYVT